MSGHVVQAELQCGSTVRTCWLDSMVNEGDVVTLKYEEGVWTVTKVYKQLQYFVLSSRKWNNNI